MSAHPFSGRLSRQNANVHGDTAGFERGQPGKPAHTRQRARVRGVITRDQANKSPPDVDSDGIGGVDGDERDHEFHSFDVYQAPDRS